MEKSKTTKKKITNAQRTVQRHKKVIKAISENVGTAKTEKEILLEAGYSESYAESGHIKDTKTWSELLEKALPDELLTKVHTEGLSAVNKIHKIVDRDEEGKPVYDFVDVDDYGVRHRYLDTAYKLKKRYDESITVKHGISGISDSELEEKLAGAISGIIGAIAGKGQKGAK